TPLPNGPVDGAIGRQQLLLRGGSLGVKVDERLARVRALGVQPFWEQLAVCLMDTYNGPAEQRVDLRLALGIGRRYRSQPERARVVIGQGLGLGEARLSAGGRVPDKGHQVLVGAKRPPMIDEERAADLERRLLRRVKMQFLGRRGDEVPMALADGGAKPRKNLGQGVGARG